MKKRNVALIGLAAAALFALTACGSSASETTAAAATEAAADSSAEDTAETEAAAGTEASGEPTVVKVGVVGAYNAQWDTVNELLAPENIQVELVYFSDYAAPNRALNDGEIDLNAFQHKAFLANDIQQKGYDLTAIGDTIIAPLAIFNNKDKISSIEDIKDGDIIAIPSDLTNGGRALKLLEAAGLIECDPEKGVVPTKTDITKYNVQIEIMEAESATLANLLPDCTAAIINGGNAFTAGLNPLKDSIYVENVNPDENPAVADLINVIVARTADKDNETYRKIVEAYQTDEVAQTLEDEYDGAFICAWEN
ncbi:MAG: MetQ/NlpA family ABC transporter substrate-binding protein [Eubacteriales bacterium]|nr:MetQ/NlpA family ABC transporter substrate-binding protein [Eubacteriales bacterium]